MAKQNVAGDGGMTRFCRQGITATLLTILPALAGAAPSRIERKAGDLSLPAVPTNVVVAQSYGTLPLTFEANLGQTDGQVRFLARGGGYTLFLTEQEAVLSLRRGEAKGGKHDVLRMGLAGANPSPRVVGSDGQPGKSNYFIGNDPSKWRTNVPHYARVKYEDVYPGIDLVYYGNERQLEHDFVVAAGADPGAIRLRFAGAKKIRVDSAGNLVLKTKGGEVALRAPVVYQQVGDERRRVAGEYRLTAKDEAAFEVGAYDRRLALVIDPVLVYSTYLGGGAFDHAHAVAVDAFHCAHVVGHTASIDYPVLNGYQPTNRGLRDVFVSRLAPGGSSLVYSTYLGGSGDEQGLSVTLDESGAAYLTGTTQSPNFPRVNPFQAVHGGGGVDAFVAVLSPFGSVLLYSTFLGGSGSEEGADVAVGGGLVTAVGTTESGNFPTLNPIQPSRRGPSDAFVTQFRISDMLVLYSTYLGGGLGEMGLDIGMDASGNAYLVGDTASADFPLVNPYQGPRGGTDAFVMKITPARAIVYSTHLGGSGEDRAYAVAVDSAGRASVTGFTTSTDFPLLNPVQGDQPGQDAYLTKLSATGNALVYSTYLGGGSSDYGWAVAVDASGAAYVTGYTASVDFPTLNPISTDMAGLDAFVTALSSETGALLYSTYLGGNGTDYGYGITAERGGEAYVVGETASTDFPVLNPFLTDRPGTDGFLTKLQERADVSLTKSDSPDPVLAGTNLTYQLTVANNGPGTAGPVLVSDTLPLDVTYVSGSSGCSIVGQTVTCVGDAVAAGSSRAFSVTVSPNLGGAIVNSADVSAPQPDPDLSNNSDSETTDVLPAADLSVAIVDTDPIAVGGQVTYGITVANAGVSMATGVVLTDTLDGSVSFDSASPGCAHVAGIVTCNLGDIVASGSTAATITVVTSTVGTIGNAASVSAFEADPNVSNNTASEPTLVYQTLAGNELRFFTATSRETEMLLEWLNPAAPYVETIVRFNMAPTLALCSSPVSPQDGTPLVMQAGVAGMHDSYTHSGVAGSAYCYAAFVHKGGGAVSLGKQVKARPVPPGGLVLWGYSTGAVAMAPVAIGSGANAVSNDNVLHAMVRGETGGQWPSSWTPFAMTGPAQHRPTSIPVAYGAATRQIILNSQDGHMYSVDAEQGAPSGLPLWQTGALGTLQAGTAGWLTAFGGDQDLLLVGTRDSGADNSLHAIDPATQAVAWSFGPPTNLIGPINAQAAVDYDLGYVYFTSEERTPGADTVWCVDLRTQTRVWSRALGSITAAPAYRNGRVYVGGDQGISSPGMVWALDAVNGTPIWSFPTGGTGAPNGYLLADRLTDDLYFSTNGTVWSLSDGGGVASSNWSLAIQNPSAPLYATGQDLVYVGSSDGALWEIHTTPPYTSRGLILGDVFVGVGPPTRDNATSLIYVGTEAGVIYAVRQPLP